MIVHILNVCLQHIPLSRESPFAPPFFSFSFRRKKRTAAPGEEKKENFRNRKCVPCRHHVTALAQSYLPAPNHLSAGDYAPHAILMMAARRHLADTLCRGGRLCPPVPNCDPAQRSQFGKEEGASGYGAFAASAETEWSWLLRRRDAQSAETFRVVESAQATSDG